MNGQQIYLTVVCDIHNCNDITNGRRLSEEEVRLRTVVKEQTVICEGNPFHRDGTDGSRKLLEVLETQRVVQVCFDTMCQNIDELHKEGKILEQVGTFRADNEKHSEFVRNVQKKD